MSLNSVSDLKQRKLWTAVLAEMIATMLFVLVSCGSTMTFASSAARTVQVALCFGFSIATLVWAVAAVSGGHLNPAVTIGFMATRKISAIRGVLYMIAQCIGAIIGAALLKATEQDSYTGTYGTPALSGINAEQGFAVELLITFVLVFAVFSSVDSQRTDTGGSVPLTIGLSILMCHLWAVPLTGAGMNPARSLGPAVVSGSWDNHWLYWVGPLIGGVLAAWIYDFLFAVNATPAKMAAFFTPRYNDEDFDQYGRKPGTNNDVTELGKP